MQQKLVQHVQNSQVGKLKMHPLQHFLFSFHGIMQPPMQHESCVVRQDKYVALPGASTCRPTSIECLQYIFLSLEQSTIYPSTLTSKSCSLSYFEHSPNG